MKVRVVDGRAVKIVGNPEHPISRGKLCPRGVAGLQILYDPDRIKGPMKRTNPNKGPDQDPKFTPVSWDVALDDIAARLKKLREEGKSHTVAVVGGRYRGQGSGVVSRFLKLYGSPNDLGHSNNCADASKKARYVMDGNDSYCAYDWENVNYVLDFGGAYLEAWRPTTLLLRMWGRIRRGRPVRAKFVMVDARYSVTASKADEWIPVNPGTDGAVALGMAHVILTEGLWNRKFVGDFKDGKNRFVTGKSVDAKDFEEKWTYGLIDWWNSVVKDFTPEKAAQISGAPVEQIKRIARELATTKQAVVGGERGADVYTNGVYQHMAIHALNGLIGSAFAKGGYMYQMSPAYGKWPAEAGEYMDDYAKSVADKVAKKEIIRLDKAKYKEYPLASNVYHEIGKNHRKGDPYKLSMLFVVYTNPLYSQTDIKARWEEYKDVFIVDTTSYMSETAWYADYILPDHSYLEKYLDDPIYPSLGYPVTGLRVPTVKPLYDTKNYLDTFIELGKRMGGKMGEFFSKVGSAENLMRSLAKGFENNPGDNGVNSFESWAEKGAWYRTPYKWRYHEGKFYEWDGSDYNKELKAVEKEEVDPKTGEKKIVKVDPVKDNLFKTKSGRFEFKSSKLEDLSEESKKILQSKLRSPELYAYPHWEQPRFAGEGQGYDLHLISPKLITTMEGRSSNVPWMIESYGVHVGVGGENWVEINPEVAAKLGIKDKDWVYVESPMSKQKVRAKLYPNPAKVVVMPYGFGRWKYGRWAEKRGTHPNELMAELTEPISAQVCTNSTLVKVYKA